MKFPAQVLAAAKRDAATLELERLQQSGQRFLPNPAGIKAWPDALSGGHGVPGVSGEWGHGGYQWMVWDNPILSQSIEEMDDLGVPLMETSKSSSKSLVKPR